MSDNAPAPVNGTEGAPPEGEQQEPKTFDAEYVAKLRSESAKYRTEAKANADAAKRLAEIEESQKSEADKQAERIKALEAEAGSARTEALRLRVATKHGISDEDADLFLTGSDEETITRQAERLAQRTSDKKKQGNYAPNEGKTPSTPESEELETARALFGT